MTVGRRAVAAAGFQWTAVQPDGADCCPATGTIIAAGLSGPGVGDGGVAGSPLTGDDDAILNSSANSFPVARFHRLSRVVIPNFVFGASEDPSPHRGRDTDRNQGIVREGLSCPVPETQDHVGVSVLTQGSGGTSPRQEERGLTFTCFGFPQTCGAGSGGVVSGLHLSGARAFACDATKTPRLPS